MSSDKTGIIVKALKRLQLFQGVSNEDLTELAARTRTAVYKQGEAVLGPDEKQDMVYIVVSGRVKLEQGGSVEEFAEMALFDGHTEGVSAVAVHETVLLLIAREDFLEFLSEHPQTAMELLTKVHLKWKPERRVEETPQEETKNVKANQTQAGEEEKPEAEEKSWLFSRSYHCPLCRQEFSSLWPRYKYVQLQKTDADFCTYYRLINPQHYYIAICPHCGFAFPRDQAAPLSPAAAEVVKKKLPELRVQEDFSDRRTPEQAIVTYRLAIACQELVEGKHATLGHLYLRLGCLYRQQGAVEEERECLQKALKHLEQAYTRERIEDPKAELRLTYLVGELHGRLGNPVEAVQWFNRVTTHPERDSYPYIVNRARERWQLYKRGRHT